MFNAIIALRQRFTAFDYAAKKQQEYFKSRKKALNSTGTKLTKKEMSKKTAIVEKIRKFIEENFPEATNSGNTFGPEKEKEIYAALESAGLVIQKKKFKFSTSEIESRKSLIDDARESICIKIQNDFIYNNTLVNIVMEFENYIMSLLRTFYSKHIDAIATDKTMSYNDFKKMSNVTEIKNYYIEKMVDDKMRENQTKWMDFLIGTLNFSLPYYTDNKLIFDEIFARRNIIMHNDSIINNCYMDCCKNPYHLSARKKIICNNEYIEQTIDILFLIATLIFIQAWEKSKSPKDMLRNFKDNGTISDDDINDKIEDNTQFMIFEEFLTKSKWNLAIVAYEAMISCKKVSAGGREVFNINVLLSKKRLNDIKAIAQIKKTDTSSFNDQLKLGYAALKDDFQTVEILIKKAISQDKMSDEQILEWPIFEELRSDKNRLDGLLKFYEEKQKSKITYIINPEIETVDKKKSIV